MTEALRFALSIYQYNKEQTKQNNSFLGTNFTKVNTPFTVGWMQRYSGEIIVTMFKSRPLGSTPKN